MATDGCWVIIYRDTNYEGDSLRIDGPAQFSNLQGLPNSNGVDWGDQIGSVKTGSRCWFVGYADDDFGDTHIVVGPNSQIPDLADLEDEIDSIKLFDQAP